MKSAPLQRALARRVLCDGRVYSLAIVDISGGKAIVEPFTVETAATPFVDATVEVVDDADGLRLEIRGDVE